MAEVDSQASENSVPAIVESNHGSSIHAVIPETNSEVISPPSSALESVLLFIKINGLILQLRSYLQILSKLFQYIVSYFSNMFLVSKKKSSLPNASEIQDVVIVGSANIDFVVYSSRIPAVGETISGKFMKKSYGGKGANQAVMVARLGGQVAFFGKVGNDYFGEDYLSQFKKENVGTDFLLRSNPDISTGVACVTVDDDGANTIITVPGANFDITLADVDIAEECIRKSKVLLCQNEIPKLVTLKALLYARQNGILSIWNPAPASTDVLNLVQNADIVCPNEVELSTMTSMPTTTELEIEAAARDLLFRGCHAVVVTLGERGACLVTKNQCTYFNLTVNTEAVDTVGAGDCFIGSFALHMARGAMLHDAIRCAIGCASLSTTRLGAQESYPKTNELPSNILPPASDPDNPLHVRYLFLDCLTDSAPAE